MNRPCVLYSSISIILIVAIVGPMSSVIAKAIVPSLNASRVVAVGGTVTTPALTAQKRGQSLKASILSIGKFDGLQGKISFDAYGDVTPLKASIRIIRNQTFVVVE